jgi:hypothetical protein
MQSEDIPNASSGESEVPSGPATRPPAKGFRITPQDASILMGNRQLFENADSQAKNKVLETCMGELYKLRPANTTFDKRQAKKVFLRIMNLCIGPLISINSRKSESGSTTIPLPLIVRLSNSLGSGLQGMPSTRTARLTSWHWHKKPPEVLLGLRNS